MAKKTSAAAASSELAASGVLSTEVALQTSANIAITKDNLVTSYGVQMRKKLEAELKRKQKELAALVKARDAAQEAVYEACKDYAKVFGDETGEAAKSLRDFLGIKLKVDSVCKSPAYFGNDAPTEIVVTVDVCHQEVPGAWSAQKLHLTRTVTAPIPADILALVTEHNQYQLDHQAKQQEIITVQRAFGKVKDEEQACMADMTSMQLEKTEEGRAILARMNLAAEQAVERLLEKD